ncbi:MAG: hypothetical protein E7575_03555 [Ruminococcaceae bacterium]|nr:hypothetical protein [Oscillospiraceae bacterium]
MIINDNILKYGEKAVFSLRELYSRYGYAPYKMSKFEEYDFYVKNKDFLISDGVITFTDTNGRLKALKPDVTLSIIKNSKDIPGFVQKLYYDENVYRVSESSHRFKEVMQVGLECIGDIDNYCRGEVVSLAAKSLLSIDKDVVLDISHLGIINAVFDKAAVPDDKRGYFISLMGEKNAHQLVDACKSLSISAEGTLLIEKLCRTYGKPEKVLPILHEIFEQVPDRSSLEALCEILQSLDDTDRDIINIDFSVVSDIKYYNGIVFKGFINGIPGSVLSGGQYDSLMTKMNKKSSAIGFAVYLDLLDRLENNKIKYDAETVLLYKSGENVCDIKRAISKISEKSGSVTVQRSLPDGFTYKALYVLEEGEVKLVENNA